MSQNFNEPGPQMGILLLPADRQKSSRLYSVAGRIGGILGLDWRHGWEVWQGNGRGQSWSTEEINLSDFGIYLVH